MIIWPPFLVFFCFSHSQYFPTEDCICLFLPFSDNYLLPAHSVNNSVFLFCHLHTLYSISGLSWPKPPYSALFVKFFPGRTKFPYVASVFLHKNDKRWIPCSLVRLQLLYIIFLLSRGKPLLHYGAQRKYTNFVYSVWYIGREFWHRDD